ncbi:MAG: ASPIC/UnbV domain-containing protein [Akkermansiaceae bacterium]
MAAAKIDQIEVVWPKGSKQTVEGTEVRKAITITEQ